MTPLQVYATFGIPLMAICISVLAVWSARRGARRVAVADAEFRELVERQRQKLKDQSLIAEDHMARTVARQRELYRA